MLRKPSKNKCIRHYTEIKTSSLPARYRTLFQEFCKQKKPRVTSNTCTTTRLTPLCFTNEKAQILSLDINISLKQHKDTMVFIMEILLNKTRSTQICEPKHSLQNFHSSKLTLSLNIQRDKNSLKAIHFTTLKCMSTFLIGSEVVR